MKARLLNFFALFSSASTLICCALPALFVALGAGSVFASLVGVFPQLVWFSEHKIALFIVAGVMLSLAIALQVFNPEQSCPTDRELARACKDSKVSGRRILIASCVIYLIGAFFAFVAPILF